MFCKSIFILFVICFHSATLQDLTSNIFSEPLFRFDYNFCKLADGWLKLHQVPATWNDAKFQCHAEGAVLASPTNDEMKEALLDHLLRDTKHTPEVIYTGIQASFSKGEFISIEGVPFSRLPIEWESGMPADVDISESCLAMLPASNGHVKNVNCSERLPYFCYKKNASLEMTECGTTDQEYVFELSTSSCYKFHPDGLSWTRAYTTCEAEGGYLAIINSDHEAQILKNLFAQHPENTISSKYTSFTLVGIRDLNDGSSWMTVHGESPYEAGYNKWHPGEPNNWSQPLGELCGSFHRLGNGFLDIPCDNEHYAFICEKSPDSLKHTAVSHLEHIRYLAASESKGSFKSQADLKILLNFLFYLLWK